MVPWVQLVHDLEGAMTIPERNYHRPVMTLGVLVHMIGDPPPAVRRALLATRPRRDDLQAANGWGYYQQAADTDDLEKTPLGYAATAHCEGGDVLLAWHVAVARVAMEDLLAYATRGLVNLPGMFKVPPMGLLGLGSVRLVKGTARRVWGLRLPLAFPEDGWVEVYPHAATQGVGVETTWPSRVADDMKTLVEELVEESKR